MQIINALVETQDKNNFIYRVAQKSKPL